MPERLFLWKAARVLLFGIRCLKIMQERPTLWKADEASDQAAI